MMALPPSTQGAGPDLSIHTSAVIQQLSVIRLKTAFADETTRKMLVEKEAFDRTLLTNLGLAKAWKKANWRSPWVADDAAIAAVRGLSVEQVRAELPSH